MNSKDPSLKEIDVKAAQKAMQTLIHDVAGPLAVQKLDARASLPIRAYDDSAGWDISANLWTDIGRPNNRVIPPNNTIAIPTGLAMRPPPGHVILVCSRSGFASKSLFVSNAPGVVDPDYTGEIKVLLYNGGFQSYYVKNGDRIAQILVVPFISPELVEVTGFEATKRGDKGFGSTGT